MIFSLKSESELCMLINNCLTYELYFVHVEEAFIALEFKLRINARV